MTDIEESKLLDIEFKTTLFRFFKNFLETADKCSEILKKSTKTLDVVIKDQLEIKHTLTEIRNNIQTPNSRPEDRKNQVKDLKYEEKKTPNRKSKMKKDPKNMKIV